MELDADLELHHQEHCGKGSLTSLAVSPAGRVLLGGCSDGYVHLWRTESNKKLRTVRVHSEAIAEIAVSHCGRFIASVAEDKTVSISSIAGTLYTPAHSNIDTYPSSVAFAPSGINIVVGDTDGNLIFLDSETAKITHSILAHGCGVRAAKYSPLGDLVVTCGDDGLVKTWDCSAEPRLQRTMTAGGRLTCLAFSMDGKYLATGNHMGEVKVWDFVDGDIMEISLHKSDAITDIAWRPGTRQVCSSSKSGSISLWDIIEKRGVYTHSSNLGAPQTIAFSHSGMALYFGTDDGFLGELSIESVAIGVDVPIQQEQPTPAKPPAIDVFRGIGLEGQQVVYKVKVRNDSGSVITNVNVTVSKYPDEVLKIVGSRTQTIRVLGATENSFQTITFRFEIVDERCVNETINATVSYFDHHEIQHTEITRPVRLTSICDLLQPISLGKSKTEKAFRSFMKVESKMNVGVCPNPEALHDVAEALERKNFAVVDRGISTRSFTVTGMATGKYTKKDVGAIIRVPLNSGEGCEARVVVGAQDSAFLPPLLREIESIVSQALDRKLQPLMAQLDRVLAHTERLLADAGRSSYEQEETRRLVLELSRKTDKNSQAAIQYLKHVTELSEALSSRVCNIDARVDDFSVRLDAMAKKMDLDDSKKKGLSGIADKIKEELAKSGARTAALLALKTGLAALGIPLPF